MSYVVIVRTGIPIDMNALPSICHNSMFLLLIKYWRQTALSEGVRVINLFKAELIHRRAPANRCIPSNMPRSNRVIGSAFGGESRKLGASLWQDLRRTTIRCLNGPKSPRINIFRHHQTRCDLRSGYPSNSNKRRGIQNLILVQPSHKHLRRSGPTSAVAPEILVQRISVARGTMR